MFINCRQKKFYSANASQGEADTDVVNRFECGTSPSAYGMLTKIARAGDDTLICEHKQDSSKQ
jgi:hypothetical protein